MNAAAIVISVIALVVSGAAVKYSRDQARSAKRSADVDERAEQRTVAADERAAASADDTFWLISQASGDVGYRLTNSGPALATDVWLEHVGDKSAAQLRGDTRWPSIDKGSAREFVFITLDGPSPVIVHWTSPRGVERGREYHVG